MEVLNPKEEYGYEKERFSALSGESFDCIICSNVVKNPQECTSCGSMFCRSCIDSWLLKRKECPNRCPITQSSIKPVGKALLRIYNDLDIQCKFFDKCKKICKLSDLEAHEVACNLPKCTNFALCGNNVKDPKSGKTCESTCLLLGKIKDANGDMSKVYKEIKDFFKDYAPSGGLGGGSIGGGSLVSSGTGQTWKWDSVTIGTGIEVSADKSKVFLKEGPYMFRTAIGDTGFMGGVHYWEIHADDKTENELKIGVATKKDFNMNSAFCDYEYGYSYYGLGQLRQGSNASGPQYGKRFKKEGVLGVFLDMNRGIMSFGLNGECFGVAYTNVALKKGPIYPAVALLHCAGCKIVTGLKAPEAYMK